MSLRDATRWIGPPVGVMRTASAFRVWRWSADDEASMAISAATRFEGPADPRRVSPGFLQPGLALFSEDGRPRCALGRHPRWVEDNVYEEALLAPTPDGPWALRGVARTDREGTVLRDPGGVIRAQRRRSARWRKEPLDSRDRLIIVGGGHHRLEAITVGESGGLWSFLSPPECVGARWVDDASGAVVAEASTEGLPYWRGDVTHPVGVRWAAEPDLWTRAAMLLLLGAMVDLSDGVHTD